MGMGSVLFICPSVRSFHLVHFVGGDEGMRDTLDTYNMYTPFWCQDELSLRGGEWGVVMS